MPANSSENAVSFEYAIIRVVPRVERGEFINVGALLLCTHRNFLQARIEINTSRLQLLFKDVDIALLEAHLQTFVQVCEGGKSAGAIGRLSQRERFRWLAAPRSTMLQTSPIHCGMCESPELALERILETSVR